MAIIEKTTIPVLHEMRVPTVGSAFRVEGVDRSIADAVQPGPYGFLEHFV